MKLLSKLSILALLAWTAVRPAIGQTERGNSETVHGASAKTVPVVISGGHETDPRDRGRPVVLIAGALGVSTDVFREAFSRVHPAPAGTEPDGRQVRDNKANLLAVLGRYGVTNDRLDEVSNYYRYVRSRGEMWPTKPAVAYAQVEKGTVVKIVITSSGSGYSSSPIVTIPSFPGVKYQAQLSFGRDLEQNGKVSAITILPGKK